MTPRGEGAEHGGHSRTDPDFQVGAAKKWTGRRAVRMRSTTSQSRPQSKGPATCGAPLDTAGACDHPLQRPARLTGLDLIAGMTGDARNMYLKLRKIKLKTQPGPDARLHLRKDFRG